MRALKFNQHLLTAIICLLAVMYIENIFAETTPESAIEHVIKKQWDKPDNPVLVSPIVIVDNAAVAGWSQGARGGRALLKLDGGEWRVMFCGDVTLTHAAVLEQSGLTSDQAIRISKELLAAEAKISTTQINILDTFRGLMKVDAEHHH